MYLPLLIWILFIYVKETSKKQKSCRTPISTSSPGATCFLLILKSHQMKPTESARNNECFRPSSFYKTLRFKRSSIIFVDNLPFFDEDLSFFIFFATLFLWCCESLVILSLMFMCVAAAASCFSFEKILGRILEILILEKSGKILVQDFRYLLFDGYRFPFVLFFAFFAFRSLRSLFFLFLVPLFFSVLVAPFVSGFRSHAGSATPCQLLLF